MLKRLSWAQVQCWLLTEAPTAAEALRREQQATALGLPADVKLLPALPATVGLALRQVQQVMFMAGFALLLTMLVMCYASLLISRFFHHMA